MTPSRKTKILRLLDHPGLANPSPQRWADLGCGEGAFTLALAEILAPGSRIDAFDTDDRALAEIPARRNGVVIEKHHADFVTHLPPAHLDGIVMANSLHYVADQRSFVERATGTLVRAGAFLLVEYDSNAPNAWVPYPLSLNTCAQLFDELGFEILSTRTHSSRYQSGTMFSALLRRRPTS